MAVAKLKWDVIIFSSKKEKWQNAAKEIHALGLFFFPVHALLKSVS